MRKPAFCICENKDEAHFTLTGDIFDCPEVHGEQDDNEDKVCDEAITEPATQQIHNNGPNLEQQMKEHCNWVSEMKEARCEKTGLRGFRPGPTQTRLYNHRR